MSQLLLYPRGFITVRLVSHPNPYRRERQVYAAPYHRSPTVTMAHLAILKLKTILHPPCEYAADKL
jgi:hypothetical protein